MSTKTIKIALDIDDTLLSSSIKTYETLKNNDKWKKMSFDEFMLNYRTKWHKGLTEEEAELVQSAWTQTMNDDKNTNENIHITQFLKLLVNNLVEDGEYEVIVDLVTARPSEYINIYNKENMPKSIYEYINNLVISNEKHKLDYHVYIDDSPHTLNNLKEKDCYVVKSHQVFNKEAFSHCTVMPQGYDVCMREVVSEIKRLA